MNSVTSLPPLTLIYETLSPANSSQDKTILIEITIKVLPPRLEAPRSWHALTPHFEPLGCQEYPILRPGTENEVTQPSPS